MCVWECTCAELILANAMEIASSVLPTVTMTTLTLVCSSLVSVIKRVSFGSKLAAMVAASVLRLV